MIAVDVHYGEKGAIAAAVSFSSWDAEKPNNYYSLSTEEVQPYEPGKFYQRELPCILKLLNIIPEKVDCIVIDGFVSLGKDQRPGLGEYLWNALNREVPIIGVAKTKFLNTPDESRLWRGQSIRPLYISAAGIGLDEAKEDILHMHGKHRIPTLLNTVDNLARGLIKAP
jgi:deoxyribonuclease V